MAGSRSWRWRNVPVPEPHLAGLVVGLLLQRRWPRQLSGRPAVRIGGVALLAAGTAVVVWATASAGSDVLKEPGRLVTGGPYAHSRNPMYVGWTLMYVGAAAARDAAWPLLLLPGVAAATHRQVRREEAALAARFGAGFEAYATRVRRYL